MKKRRSRMSLLSLFRLRFIKHTNNILSYKVGDAFVSLAIPDVQELLSKSTEKLEDDVSALESKLSGLRDEMQELKVTLYARFGRSINLET
jgi:prefoldin subunit 4